MYVPFLVLVLTTVPSPLAAPERPDARPGPSPSTRASTQPAARLGILLVDVNDYENGPEETRAFGGNLVVNGVTADSRAEKMGFRVGDVIKHVNGKDVATVYDVLKAVQQAQKPLRVEVLRKKTPLTLDEEPKHK